MMYLWHDGSHVFKNMDENYKENSRTVKVMGLREIYFLYNFIYG